MSGLVGRMQQGGVMTIVKGDIEKHATSTGAYSKGLILTLLTVLNNRESFLRIKVCDPNHHLVQCLAKDDGSSEQER